MRCRSDWRRWFPNDERVLVTGGAGFIGSDVVEELIEDGFKVDVLDTRGRHVPGAVTVLGDVRDAVSTNEAVSRCDGVIHLAGVLGTAEMVANPHPAIESQHPRRRKRVRSGIRARRPGGQHRRR